MRFDRSARVRRPRSFRARQHSRTNDGRLSADFTDRRRILRQSRMQKSMSRLAAALTATGVVACSHPSAPATTQKPVHAAGHRHAAESRGTLTMPTDDPGKPAWLRLRRGTRVLVEVAPWPGAGAALVARLSDLERYEEVNAQIRRPPSATLIPTGSSVIFDGIVEKIGRTSIAQVHKPGTKPPLFTMLSRLRPMIPSGTEGFVAGGFGGYETVYESLTAPIDHGQHVAKQSRVRVGHRVIAAQPESSTLIWYTVSVLSGPDRGTTGYLPGESLIVPAGIYDTFLHCRCSFSVYE